MYGVPCIWIVLVCVSIDNANIERIFSVPQPDFALLHDA